MKLQINKFKRHEDLVVIPSANLEPGTKKGKTTILEAFSFCLIGKDRLGNEVPGPAFQVVYDNRVRFRMRQSTPNL